MSKLICRVCENRATFYLRGGCECTVCGSISSIALPTEKVLIEYYDQFNKKYKGGGRGEGNLVRYANEYIKTIKNYIKKGTLIDIGSSTSPFPNIASKNGFQVTVTDYVKPKNLETNINFIEGTLNNKNLLNTIENQFDVVTAWAVVEHVSNPKLACSVLAGLCKPGGIILISTPEIGTNITNNIYGGSDWFHPPSHLHLLSPMAIERMFLKNNCELIKWGRFELNFIRYLMRYSIGVFEGFIGKIIKLISYDEWRNSKISKTQRFKGITYFVIKKKD